MRSTTSSAGPKMPTSAAPVGTLPVEHRPVARQLAVDGQRGRGAVVDGGDVVGDAHRQRGDHPRRRPAGGLGGGVDRRHRVVGQGRRARAPRQRPVGQLGGGLEHLRPERGDDDGERAAAVHRHGRVHPVVLAGERHRLTARQRPEHGEVLAHVADRLVEAHAEHRLDHDLVAQPDAEAQPAAGGGVHGQRLLGQHHRVARVRRHDARAELDAGHLAPDDRQHGQRVVPEDLRRPERGEPVRLRLPGLGDDVVDRALVDRPGEEPDAHGRAPYSAGLDLRPVGAESRADHRGRSAQPRRLRSVRAIGAARPRTAWPCRRYGTTPRRGPASAAAARRAGRARRR